MLGDGAGGEKEAHQCSSIPETLKCCKYHALMNGGEGYAWEQEDI